MNDEVSETAATHLALLESWAGPRSALRSFFTQVDHKVLGLRFIVTAFVFFLLGGVEALAMRAQLALPERALLEPDLYNQVFTTHGSTMMFLFAVPVTLGFGLYLVPLMIGTRECAFPRLAAYSYYTYLFGGLLLYVSFALDIGPDAGWFAYVPLSGPDYGPGKRNDVWAQLISLTEVSGLAMAVNLITTILKQRAPGMSLDRVPILVWAVLVQCFMIVFAMPAVMLASLMLATDRLIGTHFFNYGEGGDVLLWQHLFWFFGHPEVYIIFVPALGMVSTMVITFTRRQLFGHTAMVASLVATGFIGFGVWVHHMFATGIPQISSSFFSAASVVIALPTGVQFFCWFATLWRGVRSLATPMLFTLGFFAVFVVGGVTGVMLASLPLDLQVHDTFFVVAHFHYVLIGGAVFPLLGAVYYWFPKMAGRLMSERLGRWNFATFFVGFNLTFFPMHILGLRGMPRRVFTYPEGRGWDDLNLLASLGSVVLMVSVLLLIANMVRSLRHGESSGADPWRADSLEWSVSSPPPPYNFEPIPTVAARHALWTRPARAPVVHGLRADRREVLVTRLLDAEPDHRVELPGPSAWPLVAALSTAVAFTVSIFTPWGIVIGASLLAAALVGWYWPRVPFKEELAPEQPQRSPAKVEPPEKGEPGESEPAAKAWRPERPRLEVGQLASEAFGSRAPLWWGVVLMILIESTVFALLFVSYFYLRDRALDWPPTPIPALHGKLAGLAALLLLVSVWPGVFASRAAQKGRLRGMRWGLLLMTLLGAAFFALRYYELSQLPFRWDSHAHGSLFWLLAGMHLSHVIAASGENLVILLVLLFGPVEEKHLVDLEVNSLYWHFVVGSGLLVLAISYLDPFLFARGGP